MTNWTPTPEEQTHLASYGIKRNSMLDLVRMCVARESQGCYIYGRPGTSKTHTIREHLDKHGHYFKYVAGHLTPIGLFREIEANKDAIIVLDDVSALFDQAIAINILLSALSAPKPGSNARNVSYIKANTQEQVAFTGSVIAISNLPMKQHTKGTIMALKSRCQVMNYEPTNEEMAAAIMELASQGIDGVEATECLMVARYLISEVDKRAKKESMSIRLFVDKAMKIYRSWKNRTITQHWEDFLRQVVVEETTELGHKLQMARPTIRTVKQDNKQALVEILNNEPKQVVQIEMAREQLGISRATFFNYVKELKEGSAA